MKVLVLNPYVDAAHPMIAAIQTAGHALLMAETPEDALQMLQMHGQSVELAWIHREGNNGQPTGTEFLEQLRRTAGFEDLAVLMTTQEWSDAQCAEHQNTLHGANAYLQWPTTADAVLQLIQDIFAGEASEAPAPSAPIELTGGSSPVLELPTALGLNTAAPEIEVPAAPTPVIEAASAPALSAMLDLPLEPPPPAAEPSIAVAQEEAPIGDAELASAMPYLYGNSQPVAAPRAAPMNWGMPLGDALVPGGAAHSPDVETLKKYLMLREQDVAALSSQLKTTRDQVQNIDQLVAAEKARASELQHAYEQAQKQIAEFEKLKADAMAAQANEIQELQFQLKARNDKLRSFEAQVRESASEVEQIKERVRQDIRKIRVREKELENRLEIVRRDSEALLTARETKIIELKRRLDLLEFNMDLLQDQYNKQRELNQKLEEKLTRAAQVVRVAGGLLVEEKQAS